MMEQTPTDDGIVGNEFDAYVSPNAERGQRQPSGTTYEGSRPSVSPSPSRVVSRKDKPSRGKVVALAGLGVAAVGLLAYGAYLQLHKPQPAADPAVDAVIATAGTVPLHDAPPRVASPAPAAEAAPAQAPVADAAAPSESAPPSAAADQAKPPLPPPPPPVASSAPVVAPLPPQAVVTDKDHEIAELKGQLARAIAAQGRAELAAAHARSGAGYTVVAVLSDGVVVRGNDGKERVVRAGGKIGQ